MELIVPRNIHTHTHARTHARTHALVVSPLTWIPLVQYSFYMHIMRDVLRKKMVPPNPKRYPKTQTLLIGGSHRYLIVLKPVFCPKFEEFSPRQGEIHNFMWGDIIVTGSNSNYFRIGKTRGWGRCIVYKSSGGKRGDSSRGHSAWGGHGSSWLWLAQTSSYQLLCMTSEQCSVACHVTSDLEL